MPINDNQCKINSAWSGIDQHWSDHRHWSEFIGIDQNWSKQNWSTLGLIGIDQHWALIEGALNNALKHWQILLFYLLHEYSVNAPQGLYTVQICRNWYFCDCSLRYQMTTIIPDRQWINDCRNMEIPDSISRNIIFYDLQQYAVTIYSENGLLLSLRVYA